MTTRRRIFQATPSRFRLLLDSEGGAGASTLSGVSQILVGGEALSVLVARGLVGLGGEVVNLYGPTETTIWSTVRRVGAVDLEGSGVVSIGGPLGGTWVAVVDGRLGLVPRGEVGELVIGGAGVARGYVGEPALTAERFVPDWFGGVVGGRAYRTGDRVRWAGDGSLEFLGREDGQVKIRGHRVELGEIETVLRGHPSISEAVVTAAGGGEVGERVVVAYVVCGGGVVPGVEEVRRFVGERLPAAMVPSSVIWLDSMPLTANGKVDRGALPAPAPVRPELRTRFVAPAGGLAERIAAVWRAVLGIEEVGIHDNFFDLGGHSMLLARVQARLANEGIHCSMVDLLAHPTVATLTNYLNSPEVPDASAVSQASRRADLRRRLRRNGGVCGE